MVLLETGRRGTVAVSEMPTGFLSMHMVKDDIEKVRSTDSNVDESERQTLDHIIAKLSKEKKPQNGVSKKTRILLVSETNNACLSLSSSDDENDESGEPDLHQCGHCREMFYNFTKYITHKLQKVCWNPDATPTDEAAAWPLENNGMSSPGEKEADVEMEVNVEVKNLHQDLQKRKHRKGMVRRIKPAEENDIPSSNEPMVYVQADEDTVYVQAVEESEGNVLDEERVDEPGKDEDNKDHETKKTVRTSALNKYGVSLYNYSRPKMKDGGGAQSPGMSNVEAVSSKSSRSPKPLESTQTYQRASQDYYQAHMKERGFYPEAGAPGAGSRYFSGDYGPYSKYRKAKYYDEPPSSFYPPAPPHRPSKAVTYSTGRYKSDTYLAYDKYRTMANMPADDKQKKVQQSNGKNINEEETDNVTGVDSAPNLPQLVHATAAAHQQQHHNKPPKTEEGGELSTPVYDKSPPALEKCESSFAEGDSSKPEEEESNGSVAEDAATKLDDTVAIVVQPSGDVTGEQSSQSPNGTKFVMSPDKESNSPHESNHSHDTEDYSQETTSREQPEIRLPRHRQLSESTVERLITEPGSQSDASWKHAKQVYRCPLCAKIFPFKSKLQRHVLVHTGIKPYKCSVCGRGFTQQIDLQRHLTRHTGEKPFKCHLCKAQFIRADNLRKHCKDAHYVSIEEPIRKRRRKTTGSDTVLPPLEVAIALALSETERNGGRVLGRSTTRTNTRTTTKPRQTPTENTLPPAPRPEDVHPSMYGPRMSSRPAEVPPNYPPNYPPQLGPRQSIRYSFHHGPDGATGYSRRPRSPNEFHPNSPPYHRSAEGRYMHSGEPPPTGRYYPAPQTRGYFVRPGYEREGEVFYQEKDEGRTAPPSKGHPSFKVQDYRGMPVDSAHASAGYPPKRLAEHPGRPRSDEIEYSQELRKREEEYGPDKSPYRMSTGQKHSPAEYIKPRERESSPSSFRGEERDRARNPYTIAPARAEEDHRALFRGKPSISYGDYGVAAARSSESTMVSHDYRSESSYQRTPTGASDPGEFVTMATAEKDDNVIEPRAGTTPSPRVDDSPASSTTNVETTPTDSNVYVDEQETPIVTPSDDHSLATSSAAVVTDS